jgi:hypothetical protein
MPLNQAVYQSETLAGAIFFLLATEARKLFGALRLLREELPSDRIFDFGKIHFEGDHKVHVIKVFKDRLELDPRFEIGFQYRILDRSGTSAPNRDDVRAAAGWEKMLGRHVSRANE